MQRSGEMDECAVSAVAIQVGDETTLDDLFGHASRYPDAVGFSIRGDDGWLPVTYREFATKVGELANGLITSGVAPGDRVALMSRNRFEWALCDFAIWAAGAVTVPIYETSSVEQVEWILGDSGAIAVFVETPRHAAVVDQVLGRTPAVRQVWSIQAGELAKLAARGRDVPDEQLTARRALLSGSAAATIVYTSGTTGRPKGCLITHGNLVAVYTTETAAPGSR